ncbi:stimulus-sensing domain-containing protein [Roseococcus microcysteis]|uniref:stimulus-sensing domain-containing protein n=1 Tax=Roseococcus microcysteis TaxID=2771361 RepID=UPI001CC6FC6A|nr:stimulus-sensing domain-containing protein [Roseococcus microcysteis]
MPEAPLLKPEAPPRPRRRRAWGSPLLRRILLVNALPPALLAVALLYLDQYQDGLLAAEVEAMRTQARIYAGGISEAAVRIQDDRAVLVPEAARPLLRRLVEPSPNTQARLFDTAGLVVADSRVRESVGGAVVTEPLPPPAPRGVFSQGVGGSMNGCWGCCPAPPATRWCWTRRRTRRASTGSPTSAPSARRSCGWHSKAASPPISAARRMGGCW